MSSEHRKTDTSGTILVGVSAGIAAYKACYVVRAFTKAGYDVHVLPTADSLNFVGAATWKELSGNHVSTSVFDEAGPGHVELARRCDLFVVVPATANVIAKLRAGIADDMLTTTALASPAPMVVFPAMHTQMWLSASNQENVAVLEARGVRVVPPVEGDLSSGDTGLGRLAEPDVVAASALAVLKESSTGTQAGASEEEAEAELVAEGPLKGLRIVVTAGGSQEPLDPVRYVGNRSSGTQGIAICQAALDMGAEVTLIHAALSVPIPDESESLHVVSAPTAHEMYEAVLDAVQDADALVMAAAVADFTPEKPASGKIKKTPDTDELVVHLKRTEDILKTVSQSKIRPEVLVGFGAETGDEVEVLELGAEKAISKGADLLAVNRVGAGSGFGDVPNRLTYFDSEGRIVGESNGSKVEVAQDLLGRVAEMFREKTLD